jgi:hypothetical protein
MRKKSVAVRHCAEPANGPHYWTSWFPGINDAETYPAPELQTSQDPFIP